MKLASMHFIMAYFTGIDAELASLRAHDTFCLSTLLLYTFNYLTML
ncbi:hypothetical protein [Aquimarina hainanensis]